MADEILKVDQNGKPAVGFVTDDASEEIRMGRIDDTTKGLKVMIVGSTGLGTVTSITQGTGILLSPSPITTTGSVSLATSLQPIASLTGNAGKFLRVNAGETAVEYATVSGGGITIGTTTITSGTNTRVLYDNAGVVGEYTVSGSGNVAMTVSPTFTGAPLISTLTAGRIVIAGTSGVLTDDADFTYSTTAGDNSAALTVKTTTGGGLKFGSITSSFGAIWSAAATESSTNYAFAASATALTINSSLTVDVAVSNTAIIRANSTGIIFPTDNTYDLGASAATRPRTGYFGTSVVTPLLTLGSGSITMTGSIAATGARVTKGWFTDIESTNMPTVGGTAILTSLTAPQFTTIELGNASDTTLSRSAAGVLAVEGVVIPSISSTNTLTNKFITPQLQSVADAGGTLTPVSITNDMVIATALSQATTIAAPSGSPVQGEKLVIRLKDNGTARALTWNAIYRAIGVTLPTTTVINKTVYVGCIYNSTDTKWDVVAVSQEA